VVKPAHLQRSGFSCGKARCNGSVSVPTLTRNRSSGLEPLLTLPAHRSGIDHDVRLKDGKTPTWGPLYSMSRTELVVLKEWHEESMSKRIIRQSSSPFPAPVLIAKNPDGESRFCIDYGDINSKAIKNGYPLRLIKKTLNL